jgi:hypothetical protein
MGEKLWPLFETYSGTRVKSCPLELDKTGVSTWISVDDM